MDGAMGTMSHLDFKCPLGKLLVETMSHYCLAIERLEMSLINAMASRVPLAVCLNRT